MNAPTIVDSMEQHLADVLPQDVGREQRRRVSSAYMQGALDVLQRIEGGAKAEAVRSEILGWARSCIGR